MVFCDGCVSALVFCLDDLSPDVREQAGWTLGNIAGDGTEFRDVVLNQNAMDGIIKNVNHPYNKSLLKNLVWALSNLCRNKPSPPLSTIEPAVLPLVNIIKGYSQKVLDCNSFDVDDKDIIIDSCWALSYITDGENAKIQKVIDCGVTSNLVELLASSSASIVTPVLRIIGNFVSGSDTQTDEVIKCLAIPAILPLLTHEKKNIRKESCWALSNITAGTRKQINKVFNCKSVDNPMKKIVDISLSTNEIWDVRKEAIWCIGNVCSGGSSANIQAVVEFGAIEAICRVLDVQDTQIVTVAIDAITKIFSVGNKAGKIDEYLRIVDEYEGIDKLEALQMSDDENIYKKAMFIIETYMSGEEVDDENNENLMIPNVGEDGSAFNFGFPQKSFEIPSEANIVAIGGVKPTPIPLQQTQTFNFSADQFKF